MNKTLLTALSSQHKMKMGRVLVCAAVLTIGPLMAGCATTTAASTDSSQSGLTYSGGGPSSSTPPSGPAYYQSDYNPYHSD
jgi:hypothetical protein